MKKLNRNNADIENLRDKKVAVRLVGKDAEIDFRKWLEENGIHFNDKEVLLIGNWGRTEICYCVEGNSWDWCGEDWFIEKGYTLYEWEIAEEEKTHTIKDVVENACKVYNDVLMTYYTQLLNEEKTYTIKDVIDNEGKIYRSATNNCIYKYDKTNLYYKAILRLSDDWRKTELTLGEIIELKFIEYKPEPIKITFEEALKEMEQGRTCKSLFSGELYRLRNNHFEKLNSHYTTLSYKEIVEGWVVIE